ncbi:MAG: hypothetical protein M1839_002158 [Geoglossum umbratile]|nr:MAG: hypothetical protein M1839_002158 [Geoglossum umbratile]
MRMSGYFGYAIVHAIRRYVGKKLNERYTEAERSQHITQNDPRVYGQSYVANTSSCDGRRAFLDEAAQHDHIQYFQGFGKFREKGLPHTLPAEKKAALDSNPQIIKLKDRLQQLEMESASAEDIRSARNKVRGCRDSLERVALQEFQNQCVKDQRDWKIRTQGKEQAKDFTPTKLVQTLSKIMPEHSRLTKILISDQVISEQERKQAVIDLCSFITRDYTVLYLPGEEPVNGTCPVESCGKKMKG